MSRARWKGFPMFGPRKALWTCVVQGHSIREKMSAGNS